MKKQILGVLLVAIMISTIAMVGNVHATSIIDGWQIENGGGTYSESGGILTLSGGAGNKNIAFYREVIPSTEFTFSLMVKSTVLMGFSIFLRSSLPIANSVAGVNFQFGEKNGGSFLLARWTSFWTWNVFASATTDVWYKMTITVQQSPFKVTAEAFDEDGTSLGLYSASDMTNINFASIKYVAFGVWETGTYLVKSISYIPETLFVVPEYAMGGVIALTVCFAAFGVFKLRGKSRKLSKI